MHYYQHNIGDYLSHCSGLSLLEHGVYLRLIQVYYATEAQIPLNDPWRSVGARSNEEIDAVGYVLATFFERTETGYRQIRCDEEIAKYHGKKQQASEAGKASAKRRINERSTDVQPTINHKPVTNNQSKEEPDGSVETASPSDRLPACPTQEIIRLYHDALPMLPRAVATGDKRTKTIKTFWRWVLTSKKSDGERRAHGADQALTWIGAYFARAATNSFVTGANGRTGDHAKWQATIDYLCSENGRIQVIERTAVTA